MKAILSWAVTWLCVLGLTACQTTAGSKSVAGPACATAPATAVLADDSFRAMQRAYPIVAPIKELRVNLGQLRLTDLTVGQDGRNRCLLSPFRAHSGRNAPSASKFIFAPSVWLRSLIRPEPGRALAHIDFSSQEIGIAAALSSPPPCFF